MKTKDGHKIERKDVLYYVESIYDFDGFGRPLKAIAHKTDRKIKDAVFVEVECYNKKFWCPVYRLFKNIDNAKNNIQDQCDNF